jgi:hypothetical protein
VKHLQTDAILTWKLYFVAFLIVCLGVWLRVLAAGGDLWLDEIWSLNHAQSMTAWHEAFWKIIHDNNHPFNTLYLYLLGPDHPQWMYRLFSICAGGLSIMAAGWAVAPRGKAAIVPAMLITAVIFPLVQFGSEARGYSLMIACVFIATGAIQRTHKPGMRWLFAGAVLVGFWSHLSILPVAFMLCVAYGLDQWHDKRRFMVAFENTVHFATPSAAALSVALIFLILGLATAYGQGWYGGLARGCPQQGCFLFAWMELFIFSTGGMWDGNASGAIFSTYIAIGLIVACVIVLQSLGHPRRYIYVTGIFGTALLYLAAGLPTDPMGRYFLSIYALILLLVADVIAQAQHRLSFGRVISGGVLIILMGVNVWTLHRFLPQARGTYTEAHQHILNITSSTPITIGSDMTFRFATVFDYVHNRSGIKRQVVHINPSEVSRKRPEWLVSVLQIQPHIQSTICLGGKRNGTMPIIYRLETVYPVRGMSGITWSVYRKTSETQPDC